MSKHVGETPTTISSAPDTYSFDYIVKAETAAAAAPHLFIYSAADDVVPPSDVEEVADARANSGCDVTKGRIIQT